MQSLIRIWTKRAVVPVVTTLGLLLGGLIAPAQGNAATLADNARGTEIGVSSEQPLDGHGRLRQADLQRLANTRNADLSTSDASPATATPDGYLLIHPGYRRSDYVYDSDWVYQGAYHCQNDDCTLLAETRVRLHEYVYGGSSHTWRMTYYGEEYGNRGGLTWQYHIKYYCGVNVRNASDHICTNGASDSGVEVDYANGESFNKSWGTTNSITVFPMAALSTHFSNGTVVTTKFRGYDTLSRSSTTRLSTSSGTGN